MTVNYEIKLADPDTFTSEMVIRTNEDGSISSIPTNPDNSDYQAYLRWLENPEAEQSTPNLAD